MSYSQELKTDLDRALNTLKEKVLEGLDDGYFEYSIQCEKASSDTRILIITAGKSHRFSIPPEDLKR
jgi:hypothetical protein